MPVRDHRMEPVGSEIVLIVGRHARTSLSLARHFLAAPAGVGVAAFAALTPSVVRNRGRRARCAAVM